MNKDRKKDAHQKIQLGGLVVKAGLRDVDKATILGALCDLAIRLEISPDSETIKKYKRLGLQEFKKK